MTWLRGSPLYPDFTLLRESPPLRDPYEVCPTRKPTSCKGSLHVATRKPTPAGLMGAIRPLGGDSPQDRRRAMFAESNCTKD